MRKALTPTTVSRHSRRIGIVRHGSQMLTGCNCNLDVDVRVTASSELDMTGPALRAQMSVEHDDNARDCTVEWLYTVISVKHNYYNVSLSNVCGGSDVQVSAKALKGALRHVEDDRGTKVSNRHSNDDPTRSEVMTS